MSLITFEDETITEALGILERRMVKPGEKLYSYTDTSNFLKLVLGLKKREVFYVLFLNVQNEIIAHDQVCEGSLHGCTVYPRELIRMVLNHNAGGVIIAHNHPSGVAIPSKDDVDLTIRLREILSLVDCTLHDHIIIAGNKHYSLAQNGYL